MLVQLQNELAALPALLQSSASPTAEPPGSPAHAPPTPPPDPAEHSSPNTASTWQSRPYPVTTPSNSSSPRWQQLIQDPTELDILSYSTGLAADFQAGTLNIGGSLRERITDIAYAFAAAHLDYLCLQDTRQTKREGLAVASTIRELLPPGTLILQAPISKPRPSDPPPVGGQMVIISHRWSIMPTTGTQTPLRGASSQASHSRTSILNSASSDHTGRCPMQPINIYYPSMRM